MTVKLLPLIQQQFGLQLTETNSPLVEPRPFSPSSGRRSLVEQGVEMVFPNSNERMPLRVHRGSGDDRDCVRPSRQLLLWLPF